MTFGLFMLRLVRKVYVFKYLSDYYSSATISLEI